jgi:hypothetical protein
MLRVRAHYFSVASESSFASIEQLCKSFSDKPPEGDYELTYYEHTFRLTDCKWGDGDKIFSGTIWRVRERGLPSVLEDGKLQSIKSNLYEPASFAFKPSSQESILEYSHTGPKHQILGAFFEKLGISAPVSVVPVIVEDAVERMHKAALVRRIEFSLGDLPKNSSLLSLEPIASAIKAKDELAGAHIKVEISLGHKKGGLAEKSKGILDNMLGAMQGIKTLKAGIKERPEERMMLLDLIGGHLQIVMNINENDRELDHENCRERLRDALHRRVTTSDEALDDDEAV